MKRKHFKTITTLKAELVSKGFSKHFVVENGQILCADTGKQYVPCEVRVMECYHFQGTDARPDNSYLYAVRCKDGTQGVAISMYGMQGSVQLNQLMRQSKAA